jgi:hypothetical protein
MHFLEDRDIYFIDTRPGLLVFINRRSLNY